MKPKYKVLDVNTGEVVEDAFVLKPVTDRAARIALYAYYAACDNPFVKDYIRRWLVDINQEKQGEF